MKSYELLTWLKSQLPGVKFFNGTIDKNLTQCVGIYPRTAMSPHVSLGKASSFGLLPVSILVHWTESANQCEATAWSIYNKMSCASDFVITYYDPPTSVRVEDRKTRRVAAIDLLDSCPVNLSRDQNNICEMVVRANIYYETEVI